jgi:ketosteroid isomerase-like protein
VIAAGDSLAALALLAEGAVVLESGGLETKAEFRQHHLPADIRFAQSTKGERRVHSVARRGGVAWVTSTSTATGTFGGRAVNTAGAELMVLVHTPSGWRISAIHWSSRRQRS